MYLPHHSTQWIVITGAPCSGKTTVIRELERRGWRVVHETARRYIEEELARGRSLNQIRGSDPLAFQREILRRKAVIEEGLPPEERVFLDRGVPDSVGYYRLSGLDDREPQALGHRFRYHRVFLFERLPVATDEVRDENEATAARLDALIRAAYAEAGYAPVIVPVLPVERRVRFVLDRCGPDAPEPDRSLICDHRAGVRGGRGNPVCRVPDPPEAACPPGTGNPEKA